jgi:hypothetical protein
MSVKLPDVDLSKISIATCSFAASSLLVNTVAFIGQYGYACEHFGWSRPGDVLYAATIESVAVTVAAHAHQSQKHNDSALRTKLASYALGAVVGALNYSHFSSHWHPTAKAVSLGMLSALSPWLWSMFSRRVSRDFFMERGLLEGRAVKLGATRWFWHPIRSFRAMRWAAWLGEQNPATVIANSGTGNRELPVAPAGEPGTGPSANGNREPGTSSGPAGNREPGLTADGNREPGTDSGEPAGTGDPEPEPARPGIGNREPRRSPEEVAAALVPAAEAFIARYRGEHGKDPSTDDLRAHLRVKKTVACAVYRLYRWHAQDASGARAEGTA